MISTFTEDEIRTRRYYRPRGASRNLFACWDTELLLVGPAGTGKTCAVLNKVFRTLLRYPGSRALLCRKTRASMTESVLVELEQSVIPYNPDLYPETHNIQRRNRQSYLFPNGSVMVVGGLDNPDRIMSTQYDMVALFEATEALESDWEMLLTRLRNHVTPVQQGICDCNPNIPTHWLNIRANSNRMTRLLSWHKDNPVLYDDDGMLTPRGATYMALLKQSLTGTRLLRLLEGKWAAVEGQVYADWNPETHLVNKFAVPASWRRIRGIDFGYTNPSVCLWTAVDKDDNMYVYRQLYRRGLLARDFADKINFYSSTPQEPHGATFECSIADPEDAGSRALLASRNLPTRVANKSKKEGIQQVQQRLRLSQNALGEWKPKLYVMRDSLVEKDMVLAASKKPTCLEEEIESYVWAPATKGHGPKEEPIDIDNHALDCMRYLCQYEPMKKVATAGVGFGMGFNR